MSDAYGVQLQPVITLPDTERATFIVRVYQHLAVALMVWLGIEVVLFFTGVAEQLDETFFRSGNRGMWLLMLGGVMVVNWFAVSAAHDILNPSRQYLGLFAMAGAYAVMFAPFLHYVFDTDGAGTVWNAAIITGVGFAALTAVAWFTRSDLSWIRPILIWGGVGAMLLIFGAIIFGLNLGTWFSVGMIVLAGGSILYSTQNIVRNYPADAYVGAALQLFASVMTLFWYVLRLMMRR
ncbi:MAG: Bax inhibitor-1 family protein [Acidimicrobiia bacterium]|nr:Bax inhibitor-1 family protein [Acidimicrobiia bacterium]MDH5237353.1 Bax inhibitor-1 family protein [Acidimicrobiia bacterium]